MKTNGVMKMWAGLLFCVAVTVASGPGSCGSRCGQGFTRGQECSCDSDCQLHGDCCHDYQEACINAVSCTGRCREPFSRGRPCDCDSNCSHYNTCCHDYPQHCEAGETSPVTRNEEVKPDSGDLCADSPIDGLTALANGTLVVFRGSWFWAVDPVSRQAGPARNMQEVLGVAGPLDSVFTRCNCEARTYILKGNQYWVLDRHLVPEPGFPQPVSADFSGLRGSITAALPIPATRMRPETIYFFKKGGMMQKYVFPAHSTPSCDKTPINVHTFTFTRKTGPRDGFLSGEINMAASLKGFPILVTSALSYPRTAYDLSVTYDHSVFSGPRFFRVLVSGDLLVLAPPSPTLSPSLTPRLTLTVTPGRPQRDPSLPANSLRGWLLCA